jgi:hypothetical protein
MSSASLPDADGADIQEQSQEVEPEPAVPRLSHALPLDADEADVLDQEIEVPDDDGHDR